MTQENEKWVSRFQLHSLFEGSPLSNGRFPYLVGYTAGHLPLEHTILLSDYNSWLFAFDDLVDDKKYVRSKSAREKLCDDGLRLWKGLPPEKSSPLLNAGYDLHLRIERVIHKEWMSYVQEQMQFYILSMADEKENRDNGGKLSLEAYINLRRRASAVYPLTGLVHALSGVDPSVIGTPFFLHLSQLANDHISWSNDILGAQKERAEGNIYSNLVFVLSYNKKIAWEQARKIAVEMCDLKMRALEDFDKELPGAGEEIQKVYDQCKSWVSGHLLWYNDTRRYDT